MKFLRLNFLLLLFLALAFIASGQDKTAKFIPLFFEKVYLHTDREQYLAGENLWFKAYLVNAYNDTLINSSNNLYVELIAHGATIRDRKLIRMEHGLGYGDFKLSDSLAAGTYRLRAYTNWMRNFGDNFVFEKEIKIYGDKKEKNASAVIRKGQTTSAATMAKTAMPQQAIDQDTILFFPESGSMVENIQSVVAFKAENAYGKLIGLTGTVEAPSGEKVADINTTTGMGSFMLRPLAGVTYYAKGQYSDGKSFSVPLPAPLLKGLTMHVLSNDSLVSITISADTATFAELQNKPLLLTGKSKGKTYQTINIALRGPSTTIHVFKKAFPAGIACFTLYDTHDRPNCERLVYIDGHNNPQLKIETDKSIYVSREKTTITIKGPPKTHLSLAVTDAVLVPKNQVNIVNYLNLQSEIRGKIENPDRYFDPGNPNRSKQLDLLLMTQGWRDFIWRRLADSALRISYIVEKGITFTGKVTKLYSPAPMPGINVTLFIDSAQGVKLFSAQTDTMGKFFVDGVNLYGSQPFNANGVNNKGKGKGLITVDTAMRSLYPVKKIIYPPDNLPQSTAFKTEVASRLKIASHFSIKDTVHLKDVRITANPFNVLKSFGDTDIVVNRGDYKYTLGYIASKLFAKYRARMPRSGFSVDRTRLVFTSDSLPAIKTKTVNFYAIPMDKIISIHCTAIHIVGLPNYKQEQQGFKTLPFGDAYFVWLDLVVRPGAFDPPDLHAANLVIEGYYKARTFYAPKYITPNNQPDLRTTIYWEPNITTDQNGEATIIYYNADPATAVNVAVEGITPDGKPVTGTANYWVK